MFTVHSIRCLFLLVRSWREDAPLGR